MALHKPFENTVFRCVRVLPGCRPTNFNRSFSLLPVPQNALILVAPCPVRRISEVIRFAGKPCLAWLYRNTFQNDEQFTLPGSLNSWQNLQFVCKINIKKQSDRGAAKFFAHFERITFHFFPHPTAFEYGALRKIYLR